MERLILDSWANESGNVNSTEEILNWIRGLNESTYVNIRECSINDSTFWFYDDYNGEILNRKRSFFSIKGARCHCPTQSIFGWSSLLNPPDRAHEFCR